MENVLNVDYNYWRVVSVFGRPLLKEFRHKILNGKKWIGYLVHNNNLVAFLTYFFLGNVPHHDIYYPAYASTIEIKVYETDSGENYVNVSKDHKVIDIASCGKRCPLRKFRQLLDEYVELGGDMAEFCETKKE